MRAAYWNVQNVLDAAYSSTAAEAPYDAFTLNIEVLDKPGVLNQVGSRGGGGGGVFYSRVAHLTGGGRSGRLC